MPRFGLLATCGVALPLAGLAGPPQLVRDINTQAEAVSSAPAQLYDQGTWLFFTAFDGFARTPWATDGTAAGTVQLAAIPLPAQQAFAKPPLRIGTLTYFFQLDAVWVTDGTPAGTTLLSPNVIDVAPVGALNGLLIFTAGQNPQAREVWRTDGTEVGTYRVATIDPGSPTDTFKAAIIGDRLYFLANGASDVTEAWVSDGTVPGTRPLAPIPQASSEQLGISNVVAVGNDVLFAATTSGLGRELWRIDTANNDAISLVTDLAPGELNGVWPAWIDAVGGAAVFTATVDELSYGLWRSDGTAVGTAPIADVVPEYWQSADTYSGPTANGRLLFRVEESNGPELWSTNGTTATQLATGIDYGEVGIVGNHYYYTVPTPTELQLWRTDGTGTVGGTRRLTGVLAANAATYDVAADATSLYVRVVYRGFSEETVVRVVKYDLATDVATELLVSAGNLSDENPRLFTVARGTLYFDARDGVHGRELWSSDGTRAGTRLFLNLTPETGNASSAPADFVAYGDRLYFVADDGIYGRELWRSDATSAGTELVVDLHPGPGSSEPQDAFVIGSRLVFFARSAVGLGSYRLWATDGTAAGTQPLGPSLVPPTLGEPAIEPRCGPFSAVQVGPYAYFRGFESGSGVFGVWGLWRTDGTPGGTVRVGPAFASGPCWLAVLDGRVYFGADDGTGAGIELWRYDPTLDAANLVDDLWPGMAGSQPGDLTVLSGRLLFRAHTATNLSQVWRSDGTAAGTTALTSFTGLSIIGGIARANAHVVFDVFAQGTQTTELWTSDATVAGTVRLGTVSIGPGGMLGTSGRVFIVSGGLTGSPFDAEPWVTDGTLAGTSLLRDLNPSAGSEPRDFVDFNGVAVFSADDGIQRRLWRSDGTAAGTTLVGGSRLIELTEVPFPTRLAAGQNFFYVSNEGDLGAELFALSNDAPLAFSDAATSDNAAAVTIAVLANDRDPDGTLDASSVRVASPPANGTAIVQAGDIVYTPNAGFTGTDTFSYTVADRQRAVSQPATVQVVVAPPPPAAVPSPTPPPASGGGGGGGASGWGAALALLAALRLRRSRRTRC